MCYTTSKEFKEFGIFYEVGDSNGLHGFTNANSKGGGGVRNGNQQ